jgi:hypothetical protein
MTTSNDPDRDVVAIAGRAHGADAQQRTDVRTGSCRPRRLPPGGLRGMVEDYLREHPDNAFGPNQIGKHLARSGGAVANALDKLVDAGSAVLTQSKPRRYALAPVERTEQSATITGTATPDATTPVTTTPRRTTAGSVPSGGVTGP